MQVLGRRGQVGWVPRPPPQKGPPPGLSAPWGAGSASPQPHVRWLRHPWSERPGWRGPALATPPSGLRPPGGLSHRIPPLLTWGPRVGRGWGARAPGGEGRRGQGKPPAWRARGAPPPGRTQQAEAQEQGPATRAGLGARRGLGAAAWGWTWVTCGRQGAEDTEGRDEQLRPTLRPRPSPAPVTPMRGSPTPPRPTCSRSLSPASGGSKVPAPPSPAASAPRQAPPRNKHRPFLKPRPLLQVGAVPVTRARHCPVPALLPRAPGWGALGPWGPALVPASGRYALHLQPGVVHGRGHGRADSGRVDVADDAERLLQRVVHAQHLVSPLRLLRRLLHQRVLVPARVQVGQQLREDEFLRLWARKQKDGLGPDACTTLTAPRDCTLDWELGGRGVLALPPPELGDLPRFPAPILALFSDGPERKSDLSKVIDMGRHPGPIMQPGPLVTRLCFSLSFPIYKMGSLVTPFPRTCMLHGTKIR